MVNPPAPGLPWRLDLIEAHIGGIGRKGWMRGTGDHAREAHYVGEPTMVGARFVAVCRATALPIWDSCDPIGDLAKFKPCNTCKELAPVLPPSELRQ